MFYDKDLMNSKSLGVIWRAGNYLNYDSGEETSVTQICEKLDQWVGSDHDEVHRRLALRTSAVLVDGAARLYKRKMQQLFDDTEKLDRELAFPKRPRYHETATDSDKSNHETMSNSTYNKTNCTYSTKSKEKDELEVNCVSTETSRDEIYQENTLTSNLRVDKIVQTAPEESEPDPGFDQNLPFGYIMIYDSYNSRIPSRIMFSSLNPDVGKLA